MCGAPRKGAQFGSMRTCGFAISRSPVQVWSPAPNRINHLQPRALIAFESLVAPGLRIVAAVRAECQLATPRIAASWSASTRCRTPVGPTKLTELERGGTFESNHKGTKSKTLANVAQSNVSRARGVHQGGIVAEHRSTPRSGIHDRVAAPRYARRSGRLLAVPRLHPLPLDPVTRSGASGDDSLMRVATTVLTAFTVQGAPYFEFCAFEPK